MRHNLCKLLIHLCCVLALPAATAEIIHIAGVAKDKPPVLVSMVNERVDIKPSAAGRNTAASSPNIAISIPPMAAALAEKATDEKISDSVAQCPPFQAGDTWQIRKISYLPSGKARTSYLADKIIKKEGNRVINQRKGPDTVTQETEYLLDDGDIYLVKDKLLTATGEIDVDYIVDAPICPLPKVGNTIIGKAYYGGRLAWEMSSTVVTIHPNIVEISVPAGTFQTRKLKLQTITKSHQPDAQEPTIQETNITIYYADKIGVVREVARVEHNVEVYDLLEYKH